MTFVMLWRLVKRTLQIRAAWAIRMSCMLLFRRQGSATLTSGEHIAFTSLHLLIRMHFCEAVHMRNSAASMLGSAAKDQHHLMLFLNVKLQY